jgi:hypothetical protein
MRRQKGFSGHFLLRADSGKGEKRAEIVIELHEKQEGKSMGIW